jgi:citrate synthase
MAIHDENISACLSVRLNSNVI